MIRSLSFLLLLLASTYAEECPLAVNPICGSNGELYYNECTLKEWTKHQDVHAVDWADCQVDCDEPRACTMDFTPQCGSDGKIHGNRCVFLWASCGLSAPLKQEPLANCLDKLCPDNCGADDEGCKTILAMCRQPYEGFIGMFDP